MVALSYARRCILFGVFVAALRVRGVPPCGGLIGARILVDYFVLGSRLGEAPKRTWAEEPYDAQMCRGFQG